MRTGHRVRRSAAAVAAALALVIAVPQAAFAAPPPGLPGNASALESTFQAAYDYDTDGCYPTPAIGSNFETKVVIAKAMVRRATAPTTRKSFG